MIFGGTIFLVIGIVLLVSWLNMDFYWLLGLLVFIFLPISSYMIIYSIFLFLKYWDDAHDDRRKYLSKRYKRSQGAEI
ncbi:MAG: hypothetical protein ACTSRP_04185 [Candidatus Helarchaeota archaeon]